MSNPRISFDTEEDLKLILDTHIPHGLLKQVYNKFTEQLCAAIKEKDNSYLDILSGSLRLTRKGEEE